MRPLSESPRRRGYLDWLRGIAVLIMIQAHVLDAWTRPADRIGTAFRYTVILAGFAAPLFLFLAGTASVLAARSRERRSASRTAGGKAVLWRGLQIFGLAFLFRLQSYLLSPGASLAGLLKVDILNIMGPSMMLVGLIWTWAPTRRAKLAALATATIAIGMATPLIRESVWLSRLPDPIEWYLRPAAGRTTFTLFPWSGLLIAGAIVGTSLDAAREKRSEQTLMVALGLCGTIVAMISYQLSFFPTIYPRSSFWTTSPTYFFLRIGIMTLLIPLAWEWEQWRCRRTARSPATTTERQSRLQEFGRSSLFAYWIHVEMVYGILSYPLHRALSISGALVGWALFSAFIFGLVRLKNHVTRSGPSGARAPLRQPVTHREILG